MSSKIAPPTVPPVDDVPPISVTKFMEDTGLSSTTVWRFRQRGWLKTWNCAGRQYIRRSDMIEFNRRMVAGEFASEPAITANAAASKEGRKP